MITCHLYKICLEVTTPEEPTEEIFWGYHMSESLARDAALRWGESNFTGQGVSILKVDLVK